MHAHPNGAAGCRLPPFGTTPLHIQLWAEHRLRFSMGILLDTSE